jgi:hypothetical protein
MAHAALLWAAAAALPAAAQTYVMRIPAQGLESPVPAQLAASESVLAFGLVGTMQSKDLPLVLQNTGGASAKLAISPLQAPYSLAASNCPASLAGGASCTLTVRFNPNATGNAAPQDLTVSAAGTSVAVALSGAGQVMQYSYSLTNNQPFTIPEGATNQLLSFKLAPSGNAITWKLYRDDVWVTQGGCDVCGGMSSGLTASSGLLPGPYTYRFVVSPGSVTTLTLSYKR